VAQQFDFDYVEEFSVKPSGKEARSVFRFFNSKDATYMMRVSIFADRVLMTLYLDSGEYYTDTILKDDFFVLAISLKCPRKGIIDEFADKSSKDYVYQKLSDTIINTKPYQHISLMPVNKKKYTNGKLFAMEYIFDNSNDLAITAVEPRGMLSYYSKQGFEIPHGLIKEYYTHGSDGKILDHITSIQCLPVQKVIFLDTNCK
jgi:hypothetical protein